jgi:hypothetical protein
MKHALLCLALAGCYAPEARDCTLSCSAAKDCVNGQVCGADHFCAAPGVAGHCSMTDAGPPPIDAPTEHDITLTISIMGNGAVAVDGFAACTMDMCMVKLPIGVARTLTAQQTKPDKQFQMWMDGCSGAMPTCTVTPTADLHVGARFE